MTKFSNNLLSYIGINKKSIDDVIEEKKLSYTSIKDVTRYLDDIETDKYQNGLVDDSISKLEESFPITKDIDSNDIISSTDAIKSLTFLSLLLDSINTDRYIKIVNRTDEGDGFAIIVFFVGNYTLHSNMSDTPQLSDTNFDHFKLNRKIDIDKKEKYYISSNLIFNFYKHKNSNRVLKGRSTYIEISRSLYKHFLQKITNIKDKKIVHVEHLNNIYNLYESEIENSLLDDKYFENDSSDISLVKYDDFEKRKKENGNK